MNETVTERGFYLPQRPVIRESAVTTKIRIVYDATGKVCQTSTSLNKCLKIDPLLQYRLWNILIRCGDIQKVFLQNYNIRVSETH